MKENKKFIIVLIVAGIIIIAGAAVVLLYNPAKQLAGEEEEITPPAATGNVSDLTNALDKEVLDEMNVSYNEDGADLMISDSEAINSFGQAADDTSL